MIDILHAEGLISAEELLQLGDQWKQQTGRRCIVLPPGIRWVAQIEDES